MGLKNDCERDYIKEAFDKLYNCVMPYIDLTQFDDADTAFKELDRKVHSEIYILKKCLDERDRAVDAGLTRSEVDRKRISELEHRLNRECKHGENLADINGQLASENADLKAKVTLLETSRITWRSRAQHAEKVVTLADINCRLASENVDLKAKVSDLEKELAQARNSTELHLREENDRLRGVVDTCEKEINGLKKTIHELEEENISKRPWHGDGNAMTDKRTCHKSLVETIEELKAKKARLEENVDLSYGHEFEFGDEVFVPWSCDPYMYIKSGQLYNPRTKSLVYVGKDQHLKWFGEKFAIV